MALASLASIGLKTSSVDRAIHFYADLLGGEIVRRRSEPDNRVWIRLGGASLEIVEVTPWTALDESQRRSLPLIGFNVEPAELDGVVTKLKEGGIPHHGPVLKLAGEAVGVYLADPDGNGLSLSCNSGYPIAALERRNPSWAPAPYDW